jgi:small multidrug resistance family-3 protein
VVERLLIIGGLFVLAGLCEIGGGYLVWGWMRDHKPLLWALLGARRSSQPTVWWLPCNRSRSSGECTLLTEASSSRALARVGDRRGWVLRPDRWDLLGAAICGVGAFVMVAPPRG